MRLVSSVSLLLVFGLACSGMGESPPVAPPEAVAVAAPAAWAYSLENGQELVKGGSTQSLAVGSQVVLLGPPLAGTENRQIVGSAKVAEVWPDLSRVETERIRRDAPPPEMARLATPEDQATIDALPKATGASARPNKTAPAAAGGAADVKTEAADTFTAEDLPADLKGGTPDSREEALVRYENDPSMTQAIVFVMKHDSSDDVRFKAWRVVRARWNKRTGVAAEHEAAAVWLVNHGSDKERVEALAELGDLGHSMGTLEKAAGDPSDSVRSAAAEAIYEMGKRTGKRAEAKEILKERRKVESSSSIRKKLVDWIDEL